MTQKSRILSLIMYGCEKGKGKGAGDGSCYVLNISDNMNTRSSSTHQQTSAN